VPGTVPDAALRNTGGSLPCWRREVSPTRACLLVQIVLSSDEEVFGGWKNVSKEYDVDYQTEAGDYNGRPNSFLVYAPSRTVAVYAPSKYADAFSDRTEQGIPGLGVKNRGPEFES